LAISEKCLLHSAATARIRAAIPGHNHIKELAKHIWNFPRERCWALPRRFGAWIPREVVLVALCVHMISTWAGRGAPRTCC